MQRATVSLGADTKGRSSARISASPGLPLPCPLFLPLEARWHGGAGFPCCPWVSDCLWSELLSSAGWGGASKPGIFLEADLPGYGKGQDEEAGSEADGEFAVCVPGVAAGPLRILCHHSYNCRGRKERRWCQSTAGHGPPSLPGWQQPAGRIPDECRVRALGGYSMLFPAHCRIPRAKGEGWGSYWRGTSLLSCWSPMMMRKAMQVPKV